MALTWGILTGTTNTPGSIARWLNKSALTAGTGGDADIILAEAVNWIDTRLRHWKMLAPPSGGTMTAGGTGNLITLPTDMHEPDWFSIEGTASGTFYQQELRQVLPNDLYRRRAYDTTGARVQAMPLNYTFNKTYIELDSVPDIAYPYLISYYQHIPELTTGAPTNFLTDYYPRLLRCACMMTGVEYVKENVQGPYDRTYWEQQSILEIQAAQADGDSSRRGADMFAVVV